MKRNMLLLFVLSTYLCDLSYGQCNPYFEFEKGSQWEITNYNAKDKSQGRQTTEILDVDTHSDGWDAKMKFVLYDKKDELVYDKEIEMSCQGGVVAMDITRLLPDEQLEAFQDLNMKIEMDNLEIPAQLEAGMALDDGSVTISGDLPMKMTVAITDRVVEGKESVTTPAGVFDCYKINYSTSVKMMINRLGSGADWIAEGVGLVKTESYNSSGKLVSYSLLTSR